MGVDRFKNLTDPQMRSHHGMALEGDQGRLFTRGEMDEMFVEPPSESERIMPHAEMAIGVDANHVPAILRAGRLLSQHDTGTSGGSYDPDYRRDTEDDWGMEKPIYGVWRHPEIEDRIWGTTPGMHDFGAYGNVTFQAKRNLQGKQFFTHGDSLGNPVPPTPIGEADRRFDRSLPKSVTYIESQFQPDRPDEGLPLSDIKSAEVRVWGSKTDDIENFEIRPARAIQDYGIPTTVFRRGTMTQPTLGHQFNDEYSEGQASRRNKFNASLREHDEETGERESSHWNRSESTNYLQHIPRKKWYEGA